MTLLLHLSDQSADSLQQQIVRQIRAKVLGGELAADAILEAFERKDFSARQLGAFGPQLAEGMEAFRRLVYAFYTPGFSFASFVNRHPEHREDLIRILIGDVFTGGFEKLYKAMEPMCEFPEPQPLG